MKEIKAVIGPHRLEPLRESLRQVPGFPGMTVGRAEGYVAPSAHMGRESIRQALTDHVPRLRVEMLVPDEVADVIFDAVVACVSRGSPGDSMVWMTEVTRSAFVHKTV